MTLVDEMINVVYKQVHWVVSWFSIKQNQSVKLCRRDLGKETADPIGVG